MPADYIDKLAGTALFSGIRKKDLEPMLHCTGAYTHSFRKDELIYRNDEHLTSAGLVLSGAVHMILEDVWGEKTLLAHIYEGEIFGETFACGTNQNATVSFVAAEPSRVLFLPFERMMHTCSNACSFHHQMIENMVTIIADKNLKLMKKLEIISQRNIRGKILAYLSDQAQTAGSSYFEIPLGRIEMAEYLGVDRSALTRELTQMRKEGVLDYDRNTFRLYSERNVRRK